MNWTNEEKKFHMNFVDFFQCKLSFSLIWPFLIQIMCLILTNALLSLLCTSWCFFPNYCCSQLHTIFQFIFAIRYLNTIFCLFHRMHQRIIYYIKRTGLNKFRHSNGKKEFQKDETKNQTKSFWIKWMDVVRLRWHRIRFFVYSEKAFSRKWSAIWPGDTYTLPPQNDVVLINISKTHMHMTGLRWHSFQLAILLVCSTSIIRRWLITCERL